MPVDAAKISRRRAMAIRCTTALVEQPVAMATTAALRNAGAVAIRSGVSASQTISTMRRPHAADMRLCPESAAGIEDAPGRLNPNASAMAVMVEAVPIFMQVPSDRARRFQRGLPRRLCGHRVGRGFRKSTGSGRAARPPF